MAPKFFVTGATGYVCGDVLHCLLGAQPSLAQHMTCSVRSEERGKALIAAYPDIKLVYGTLEDSDKIEEESSKADIVLDWADCDHVGAAEAIKRGLQKGKGGIWIHTSGTDILNPLKEPGTGPIKVYDDWDNIKECLSFPHNHPHRPVDKIVLSSISPKIKTAIICPPTIWGLGRGTGNRRSIQIYNLCAITLTRGSGIKIPHPLADKLFWQNIHLWDLTNVYLELINDAIGEFNGQKVRATWNEEGYYFAENGRFYWQEVAGWIAEEAARQGLIKSAELTQMSEKEKEEELRKVGVALWNTEFDCKSVRARKLFGWKPEQGSLKEEVPEIVRGEGKMVGHLKE